MFQSVIEVKIANAFHYLITRSAGRALIGRPAQANCACINIASHAVEQNLVLCCLIGFGR